VPTAEPGSFRDPDSAVFTHDGAVLRGLSERAEADWQRLEASTFFPRLMAEGRVVDTARAGDDALATAPPSPRGAPWAAVLRHERIPVVSYPYEWPFAMLREAALCQLDVLAAALEEGMSLKDGTAYNVQFVGTRPTFVDVGSFEAAAGPWPGYRQFCRTMLFPLLVQAHLGVPYQPLLRGAVDGLTPSEVRGMFGGLGALRKGVLRNVVLHAVLERRVTGSTERTKAQLRSAGFGTELAKATTAKLRALVTGLDVDRKASTWSDYRDNCSYSGADAEAKRAFVEAALVDGDAAGAGRGPRPSLVLDLGANDGEYALLAAEHAGTVVAVDADQEVVDRLYRRLRAEDRGDVLPLVMNLVDPSGGIGWRNRERAPFADRVRPDVTLALALVHHLAIGANVPLAEVVAWLRSWGGRLVVEFVHPDDVQVTRLLANKPAGLFDDYRRDGFEALLAEHFAVHRRVELPGGTRTLYLAEAKAA
jgi:SAM-dependent methyltransferase